MSAVFINKGFLKKKVLNYYYFILIICTGCVNVSNDPIERINISQKDAAEYVLSNVSYGTPENQYLRAKAFVELGQLDAAHRELTSELMQRTVDARYSFLLGKVSCLQEDYQSAQKQLRDALELGFNQPELFQLLANTYVKLGYTSRALATTERLLEMDRTPDNESLKGKVLLSLGDTAQAVKLISTSMQQDSSLRDNYYELISVFMNRREYDEATLLINRYINRYPEDQEMSARKGQLLISRKDYEGARKVYEGLMAQAPRNAYYLQQHSKTYFLQGRYDSALIQARRALVLDESDIDTRVIEARSLENQRLFDEAKEAYSSLLATDSSIVEAQEGYERIDRRENYLRYLREQEQKKREEEVIDLQPINPFDGN